MVKPLKLRVEGQAVNDPYARSYGLGIDQPLDRRFWETQPHKFRRYVGGFFIDDLDIPDTTKYVVVGVSAFIGYWIIRVYVDGKLIGEKPCAVPDAYPGSPGYPRFDIVAPPPPPPPAPKVGAAALISALAPVALGIALYVFSNIKFKGG